jgi:microcompartment protein CcmL/EutN
VNNLGLLEFREMTRGIVATDQMLKAAPVELILATSVCPGKFITLVAGEVGAVKEALRRGKETFSDGVIDEFFLANIHPTVIPALTGTMPLDKKGQSLGLIETFTVAAAIRAGDAAAKGAEVTLAEIRIARGMGGKSLVIVIGEVSAVKTAVQLGVKAVDEGQLVSQAVISNVSAQLMEKVI